MSLFMVDLYLTKRVKCILGAPVSHLNELLSPNRHDITTSVKEGHYSPPWVLKCADWLLQVEQG